MKRKPQTETNPHREWPRCRDDIRELAACWLKNEARAADGKDLLDWLEHVNHSVTMGNIDAAVITAFYLGWTYGKAVEPTVWRERNRKRHQREASTKLAETARDRFALLVKRKGLSSSKAVEQIVGELGRSKRQVLRYLSKK